jgi:hypothetical protein
MDASKFVTDRCKKRQNRKFGSNVASGIAGPIDLRISKLKYVFQKILCDRRNVALPPTPMIDIRLNNQDEPHPHG